MKEFKETVSAVVILIAVAMIFFLAGLKAGKEVAIEKISNGYSCSAIPDGSGYMICK